VHVVDPDLKALAHRAIDAATAAGASYADIRFTITRTRRFSVSTQSQGKLTEAPREAERIAAGVRALSRGAWGFMADTELTPDMMDWLGRTAADLGKASAWPQRAPIELGARPPVAMGNWQMLVARDPFTVSDAEHQDLLRSILDAIEGQSAAGNIMLNYGRQERTFASSDGAFTTQTVYNTFSDTPNNESCITIVAPDKNRRNTQGKAYYVPLISPRGDGFEFFQRERIVERIPEWVAIASDAASAEALESPGRFEVVFDAYAMAGLVNTLGAALEVDRALGYEANASGTSYLSPLHTVLGTHPLPAGVTVSANRAQVGGAATVQWDDEGVAPQKYTLVNNGMLVDYATSREFVSEMSGWYQAHGQTIQSRGCAASESALSVPLVQTPNLQLHPGTKDMSFEELLVGIDDGIAVLGGDISTDQQQLNIMGGRNAVFYTVKKGKLAGPVKDARYMVRMPELWKDLVALGGARSAGTRGFTSHKGQPAQLTTHSVQAVAGRFRNVVVRSIARS
jgi:TldD protein